MKFNSRKVMIVFGWTLIAIIFLLSPSPREWGTVGRAFGNVYDEIRHVLQPAAHFILMALGSILLMRHLSHRTPSTAFINTVVIVLSVAVALELLQDQLPRHFARACDPKDLIPSAVGAISGGLIGLFTRAKRTA